MLGMAKFIENLFSIDRDGDHPECPVPVAVVHRGKDGKWYANVGDRLAENFDTKFVLSIEEASEDKGKILAMVRHFGPEWKIVERDETPE